MQSSKSLKIVGIDPERNFSGGETQVMGLTRELLRIGHRAELVCDPEGQLWKRARLEGVICHPLRMRNSIDLPAALRLRALLASDFCDVLHFHTARAHSLAPFTRRFARAQIVTRRMDYPPNRYFGRYLYNRAVDRVIAISAGVAEAAGRGGAAPSCLRVVPSGVDCARFAPPSAAQRAQSRAHLGLDPADVAVGAIGALVLRKGHRILLDAMALAKDQNDMDAAPAAKLHCFIAGAGPLAGEFARSARELSDQRRNITMLGPIEDPRTLLYALDLFVMPSHHEGLGVAALEAMACGLPVIASNVGGLPEVIVDQITGKLTPPGDVPALARELVSLARAPEVRIKMGLAGRARALARFSMEAMARGTLNVYCEALAER